MAGDLGSLNILLSLDMSEFTGPLSKAETQARASTSKIAAGVDTISKSTKAASESMHSFSLDSMQARRELMVLAHEASQGSWKNFAGSLMVLAEATDALSAVMSPAGLAIGAFVGALALAGAQIYHGHEDWVALNKAVTSTGGAVGLTAEQIDKLAPSVAAAGGSISDSEKALIALTATGRISGDQLTDFGRIAVEMAHDTGDSIEKVAENLAGLSDDAVKWAEDYNKQHHFLTASQYDLVKALQDTGDTAGAAKAVVNSLEEAHARMSSTGVEQVGLLEKSWNGLVGTLQSAKHWLGEIGKPDTTADLIKDQTDKLKDVDARLQAARASNNQQAIGQLEAWRQSILKEITPELDRLKALQAKQSGNAAANANTAAGGDLAVKLGAYNDDRRYATPDQQHQLDTQSENNRWATINAQYAKYVAGNDAITKQFAAGTKQYQTAVADRSKIEADYAAGLARHQDNLKHIDEQYAKSQNHGSDNALNAQLTKLDAQAKAVEDGLKSSLEHIKSLRDQGVYSAQEALDKSHEARVKALKDELDIVSQEEGVAAGKKQLSALAKYQGKAKQLRDAMLDEQKSYTDDTATLAKQQQANINAYSASLDKLLQARKAAADSSVAAVGMGSFQRDQANKQDEIQKDWADRYSELTLKRQTHPKEFSDHEYQSELKALGDYENQRVAMEQDTTDRLLAAQGDWTNGAKRALDNYATSAADVASQTEGLFNDAFSGMEDALVTFATTGSLSFKSMADSIIKDLARMAAKAATNQLFQLGATLVQSYFADTTPSGLNANITLPYNADYDTSSASVGGTEQYPWLAGARATGGSTDAGSAYLIGERGPEVFVPDVSGKVVPNNRLSSLGGGDTHISTTIQLSDSGASSQTTGDSTANAKALADLVNTQVQAVLAREQRQGGVLWRMKNGG